jgi:hypothetical protein
MAATGCTVQAHCAGCKAPLEHFRRADTPAPDVTLSCPTCKLDGAFVVCAWEEDDRPLDTRDKELLRLSLDRQKLDELRRIADALALFVLDGIDSPTGSTEHAISKLVERVRNGVAS